jgi:hypothetical protein
MIESIPRDIYYDVIHNPWTYSTHLTNRCYRCSSGAGYIETLNLKLPNDLKDENWRQKHRYTEQYLDHKTLKDAIEQSLEASG